MNAWERAGELSAEQHGVISRAQCLSVGLQDKQLARASREGGRWQRVLPGVYATFTGPLSQVCLVMAAVLFAGPQSQVTGVVALTWYGCTHVPRAGHVDLLIPWERRRRGYGYVRFHRSRRMPLARTRGGVPMSPVERAAMLAARQLRDVDTVRAVLSEVVQRRLTTVDRLAATLADEPTSGSALPRRVLDELGAGTRSVPEMWLRDLVLRRPRLARGVVWNHPVQVAGRTFVADACWPLARLIVEVDSIEHHGLGDGPERTSRRRAALTAAGWTVLSVSPRRLRDDPMGVLAQIEALVTAAG